MFEMDVEMGVENNRMDVEKSQRVPLQFLDVLQQWMLRNAKGFPLLAR